MNEFNKPITFSELLQRCRRIEIPLIQRDYAQGREAEKDVRDEFLKALLGALSLPLASQVLPLNLDFIYGSMESEDKKCFLPLDGQQRLTTLFLLHWYLAWRDNELSDFKSRVWDGKQARFTYRVRPSSTEFFDEIINYQPACNLDNVVSVKKLLEDQHWFFLHWRLDPTIQSALNMFDAIHERFKNSTGLYARLVNQEHPVITFQLLPLEHFGLTDDLYIKMNARGKPLTTFETFKARYEELLKELFPSEIRKIAGADLSIAEFFTRRIDTEWTDFFWNYKNLETHTFDDSLMKLIWSVVRVSLNPESASFISDSSALRIKGTPATYTLFHDRGWLTREFALNLICLLEAWGKGGSSFTRQLPDKRYFDEKSFFEYAIWDPAGIEYTGQVMFAAFVFYLRQHDGSVQAEPLNDWLRVVRNLSFNTNIERPEEYGRSLAGLNGLLPHSHQILQHLTKMEIEPSFNSHQVQEEVLKAKLILSHPRWRNLIDAAEQHGYFQGQIEFLLDFSGVSALADKVPVQDWEERLHTEHQDAFDRYYQKARLMFNGDGLISTGKTHLWMRALLVIGNYLLQFGRNYSFLSNPATFGDSWKRFLRLQSKEREYLKSLWDHIETKSPVEQQLNQIITAAQDLEPWRAAIVKYPEMIDYCEKQEFRWEAGSDEMYLLKKQQMNGFHVELFSYALHHELVTDASRKYLEPLKLESYQAVTMTEIEPCIRLSFGYSRGHVSFALFSNIKMFHIHVSKSELPNLPDVEAILRNNCEFVEEGDNLARSSSREEVQNVLRQIASSLAKLA